MREILQWWTGLELVHTSTFGVRVYRRGSMLIDHVDRMEKTGDEVFYSLPYRNEKDGMQALRAQVKNMD